MKILLTILIYFFGITATPFHETGKIPLDQKVKGITMVAPPEKFSIDPIHPITDVNADWIALVPFGFSETNQPNISYNSGWQWWGEKPEGVRESIRIAREKNVKVMVKPQVYIHGSWVGEVDYKTEAEWKEWEASYKSYILTFAKVAQEEGAEMFCVGTEYKIAVRKREKFWRALISSVREIYSGHIIYSSNWDGYQKVPIWDAVDYIGLSAYFPLSSIKTPTVNVLKKEWKPIVNKLKKFSIKHNKQIIFTEYGYLSVDGCADKAWLLEKKIPHLEINETGQANAYEALLSTFGKEKFWAGGFLWKWFPNMQGHEGYPDKDYTPQGKVAEEVIRTWYGKI